MKKFALLTLVALGLAAFSSQGRADDVTITGNASCAKCSLNMTSECQNAITVIDKDGKKEVLLVEPTKVSKSFHSVVCQDTVPVKAEGTVSVQNGQKVITLTKIEEVK